MKSPAIVNPIVAMTEEGDVVWLRGHLSPDQAQEILVNDGMNPGEAVTAKDLSHVYGRMMPIRGHGYDIEIRECPKGRGAFAVTRVDL